MYFILWNISSYKAWCVKIRQTTLHDSSRSIRRDINFSRGVGDSGKRVRREGDAFACMCVRACVIARSSRSSARVENTMILFLDAYIAELQQSHELVSTLRILGNYQHIVSLARLVTCEKSLRLIVQDTRLHNYFVFKTYFACLKLRALFQISLLSDDSSYEKLQY